MTVYVDILILVNLYLDFFLLCCVRRLLGLRAGGGRLLLGAAAGTVFALPELFGPPRWCSLLLSAAAALAMTAGAFCPMKLGQFLKAALCQWLCAMGLAGVSLFLLRWIQPKNLALLGTAVYINLSPMSLFFFTLAGWLLLKGLQRLLPELSQSRGLHRLRLRAGGRQVSLWARADSGCSLREPFSGLPVLVCRRESLGELLPESVRRYLEGDSETLSPGLRLAPYSSLGGEGLLPAFLPEQLETEDGRRLRCYVAVSAGELGTCDALGSPELLEGELC